MVSTLSRTRQYLEKITGTEGEAVARRISERRLPEGAPNIPPLPKIGEMGLSERQSSVETSLGKSFPHLFQHSRIDDPGQFSGNIENLIGFSAVPTGIIGPVRIIGSAANGDFLVPLATSEGALVASYHRGSKAAREAGGVRSVCLSESVQRSPVFQFKDLGIVGKFLLWIAAQEPAFHRIVAEESRHAKLLDLHPHLEGNRVIITFEYSTGDAAGQNMVTLCTSAICRYIIEETPVKPDFWYLESNFSGDKKATSQSFLSVRGKKVSAEAEIPANIISSVLKSSADNLCRYTSAASLAAIQAGSIGAQGHYANALTALFIACGQDAACIAESAVGITRFEVTADGGLYASVTLPNLIVGTVGGGTSLPTQMECLSMIGCAGSGNARKFAEICGAVVLCGELSIAAAMAEEHFSHAHRRLGRKKKG